MRPLLDLMVKNTLELNGRLMKTPALFLRTRTIYVGPFLRLQTLKNIKF